MFSSSSGRLKSVDMCFLASTLRLRGTRERYILDGMCNKDPLSVFGFVSVSLDLSGVFGFELEVT